MIIRTQSAAQIAHALLLFFLLLTPVVVVDTQQPSTTPMQQESMNEGKEGPLDSSGNDEVSSGGTLAAAAGQGSRTSNSTTKQSGGGGACPKPVPLHDVKKLGGTAPFDGTCDVPLYTRHILPIYLKVVAREAYTTDESNLIRELTSNHLFLRNQSCYGYVAGEKPASDGSVAVYMECHNETGTCRCLGSSQGQTSSMLHRRTSGGTASNNPCFHPIDILNKCDRRAWLKHVEPGLARIRRKAASIKDPDDTSSGSSSSSSPKSLLDELAQELQDLLTSIRTEFLNNTQLLQSVCFTEDLSLVCNKRGYCTCHHSKHFYFVRSGRVDRCVPTQGSYCQVTKLDECRESCCLPAYNGSTTFYVCGGVEGWKHAPTSSSSPSSYPSVSFWSSWPFQKPSLSSLLIFFFFRVRGSLFPLSFHSIPLHS